MCRRCIEEHGELQDDCPFEPYEHHPDQWSGEREDYPDELPEPKSWDDKRGKPYDSNWRRYNPYQGSVTPTEGRCNAVLSNWEDRYGEPRYCTRLPERKFGGDSGDSDRCKVHKFHDHQEDPSLARASELLKHGLYSKTIRTTFEALNPWQKVVVLGWYDSYIEESEFDFDERLETFEVDFSEYDEELPLEIATVLEDEQLTVDVPIPQQHENRAHALYRAAIADMKTTLADRELFAGEDEAAMEREVVISVTEEGREVTDLDEHHLNLPISRVDKDRKELLAFGGVNIDGDDISLGGGDAPDLVLDLDNPEAHEEQGNVNPVEEQMMDSADDGGTGGDE